MMDTLARLFATHRVLTGVRASHGYVYDRLTGRVVQSCTHRHRHSTRAQACAEQMLRRLRAALDAGTP